MKTIVALLLLTGMAFAKDPPKKDPHIYVVFAIYNKASTDSDGHTWYALMCKDAKGDKIVVGVSKDTIEQLHGLTQETAIKYSYGK